MKLPEAALKAAQRALVDAGGISADASVALDAALPVIEEVWKREQDEAPRPMNKDHRIEPRHISS